MHVMLKSREVSLPTIYRHKPKSGTSMPLKNTSTFLKQSLHWSKVWGEKKSTSADAERAATTLRVVTTSSTITKKIPQKTQQGRDMTDSGKLITKHRSFC